MKQLGPILARLSLLLVLLALPLAAQAQGVGAQPQPRVPADQNLSEMIERLRTKITKAGEDPAKMRMLSLLQGEGTDATRQDEMVMTHVSLRMRLKGGDMVVCGAAGGCAIVTNIPAQENFDNQSILLIARPTGRETFCQQLSCASLPRLRWIEKEACSAPLTQTCAAVQAAQRLRS